MTLIENKGDIAGVLGITINEFETGWYELLEVKYLN